jgi:hypothetical protein
LRRANPMSADKPLVDAKTAATIDKITLDLLADLELQTRVVLNLLARASEAERQAHLERLAELRGRLVGLRSRMLGGGKPKLVSVAKRRVRSDPT